MRRSFMIDDEDNKINKLNEEINSKEKNGGEKEEKIGEEERIRKKEKELEEKIKKLTKSSWGSQSRSGKEKERIRRRNKCRI